MDKIQIEETQKKEIEEVLKTYSNKANNARTLITVLKESLINVHGEYNKTIESTDVELMLDLALENITPVDNLIHELSFNLDCITWDNFQENI